MPLDEWPLIESASTEDDTIVGVRPEFIVPPILFSTVPVVAVELTAVPTAPLLLTLV